ncbi:hypothetical protein K469DRAFT_658488 [Zopfia rhizophila CBS 207.26]|uniref:RNA polymerase II assembly factor Rtp1 C-terminal domain-containing protein n=1 Tax=Zopfia rhizophila CBS 207.26 TaxID=1314779 RepID=A0A6A6EC39_9PEZI|nr:hypothetical protein K469DRAFT_658488 [Zopfia rhizophila CBS 207.26]
MGAVEDAVDAAADFVGPLIEKNQGQDGKDLKEGLFDQKHELIERALFHLQAINEADQAKDPDSPYDGSLFGVVYALIDLITLQGILPSLSPGVAFAQRPRSVLIPLASVPGHRDELLLSKVIQNLLAISEQNGTGVQPLLTQRLLPDLISGLAELAFSPRTSIETRTQCQVQYEKIIETTPTSRLLPILASYLQQDLPPWLRQSLSNELAVLPLRPRGVRHTIEFVSLSYLSKNLQVPKEPSISLSQIPIPLEAITQASRLLASVPSKMNPIEWFTRLAPQLLELLDGGDGVELSRAAGRIIAGGILNRKSTGAPGMIGWELLAKPLLQALNPGNTGATTWRGSMSDQVVVPEKDLVLALRRLSVIVTSYSHPGLIKRLVGPVLLPLWGLMGYAKSRASLDSQWTKMPSRIISRYMDISCDPKQVDQIATNLFWEGELAWAFGPGADGGVEIRRRKTDDSGPAGMGCLLSHIEKLDDRVASLVTFLAEANIDDDVAGIIFLNTTKRWLSAGQTTQEPKASLIHDKDADPLGTLADAKLSEAMATKFKDKLARSPRHIVELVGQLVQEFVSEHKSKSNKIANSNNPSRANLGNFVDLQSKSGQPLAIGSDSEAEDLVSFALSILSTVVTSPDFKKNPDTSQLFSTILPSLQYLFNPQQILPLPPAIKNAATNLISILQPAPESASPHPKDDTVHYRTTLHTALSDLTSSEPPNRTWALSALQKLMNDPTAFPLIDVPSTTHMILSSAIADSESYVYTAAIPVLVSLATLSPNPTVRILTDAFMDVDERALRLRKEKETQKALDYRLRIGEVLNQFVLADEFWSVRGGNVGSRYGTLKMLVETTLSLAGRRGQRTASLERRNEIAALERKEQEEGEKAWDGPIPNLLADENENPAEQKEREALAKIVEGWQDTGIEEDVRIRASTLSILGSVLEKRLQSVNQPVVDAALQMVLMILVMERGNEKEILRRAAVLVVMGLLKGMDGLLEEGNKSVVGLGLKETEEVERVMKWVRDEDGDALVKSHAENVLEGMETWRMKKWFGIKEQVILGPDLGLEGNLRGLNVNPLVGERESGWRAPIVEEIE